MSDILWNRLKYILSPQFDIYNKIKDLISGDVADIGSGSGFGTYLLSINAEAVVGFDSDESAIKFSKSVFAFKNVNFVFGDIVVGIGGKYDFVTMIDVIEHIEDDLKALQNVRNMLKENGILILSTPNKHSRYRKSDFHIREYSPKTLFNFLKSIFPYVYLKNYDLKEHTKYDNPIIAFCSNNILEEKNG